MYAIDIDGTIAGGGVNGLLDYLRERLRLPLLDIPPDLTWQGVEELSEIKAFREKNARKYTRIRNQAMGSLLVLRDSTPIPGAVETIKQLASIGEVVYVTIRSGDEASASTTKRWLKDAGFPNPDNVTFCASFLHKVRRVLREPGTHILIDDRWQSIVLTLRKLEKSVNGDPRGKRYFQELRERLTLVAFGAYSLSAKDGFPGMNTVVLPSWSLFDEYCSDLIPVLEGV